jgi:prepilin-type processing-associated H-X9-DG protein
VYDPNAFATLAYPDPVTGIPRLGVPGMGALTMDKGTKLDDISDGTSNTILYAEIAARPTRYINGKREGSQTNNSGGGGWGDSTSGGFVLQGSFSDGVTPYGPCVINCSNDLGLNSFHTGGVQAVFVDGSVHFISSQINTANLIFLITKAGSEVITDTENF